MNAPTPSARGFRMPAEWEPHAGTWLTWPRRQGISFPDAYDHIPALWARLVYELAAGEDVHINCFSEGGRDEAEHALGSERPANIYLHDFPAREPWCRDHGPIFLRNSAGTLLVTDWEYNAWGGKYLPYDLDNEIPRRVADYLGLERVVPGMVLEGGAIDVDGQGTLVTTEACLLNPNRNPQLSKAEIESRLRDFLGVQHIIWLGEGIVGDDTDGHIDDLTRFVAPGVVVTAIEGDPSDENYDLLRDNRRRLELATDARGCPLEIIDLPMPGTVERDGQRLPASYANFYIANEIVLLPGYQHINDEEARDVLQRLFPTKRVLLIDSTDLIWGLGSFHCITQQMPRHF